MIERMFFLGRQMERFKLLLLLCCFLSNLIFSIPSASADYGYQTYTITDGYFSPASAPGSNEDLTGYFTIVPRMPTVIPPDGGAIVYPSGPPSYLYASLLLSSENYTITNGTVELMRGGALIVPNFGYDDLNNFLINPVILECSTIGHGFNNGREYYQYFEQALVPVQNSGSNSISYDSSGSYFPSSIHFTYELTDYIQMALGPLPTPGVISMWQLVTESTTPLGTVSFDASPASVPGPGSLWLLGSGLIWLASLKRRLFPK